MMKKIMLVEFTIGRRYKYTNRKIIESNDSIAFVKTIKNVKTIKVAKIVENPEKNEIAREKLKRLI